MLSHNLTSYILLNVNCIQICCQDNFCISLLSLLQHIWLKELISNKQPQQKVLKPIILLPFESKLVCSQCIYLDSPHPGTFRHSAAKMSIGMSNVVIPIPGCSQAVVTWLLPLSFPTSTMGDCLEIYKKNYKFLCKTVEVSFVHIWAMWYVNCIWNISVDMKIFIKCLWTSCHTKMLYKYAYSYLP